MQMSLEFKATYNQFKANKLELGIMFDTLQNFGTDFNYLTN